MLMGLPEFNDIDPPMEKVSQLFGILLFHVLSVLVVVKYVLIRMYLQSLQSSSVYSVPQARPAAPAFQTMHMPRDGA